MKVENGIPRMDRNYIATQSIPLFMGETASIFEGLLEIIQKCPEMEKEILDYLKEAGDDIIKKFNKGGYKS